MALDIARARAAAATATIVAAFSASCASVNPLPVVPSTSPSTCQIAKIEFGQETLADLAVTSVRQVKITAATETTELPTVLRDQPEVPTIRWKAASADTKATLEKIAEENETLRIEPYSGGANLDQILQGLEPIAGTHLAYAAVRRKNVPVVVTCAQGQTVTGDFSTWEQPETGVLTCGVGPGSMAPPVAVQILQEHCR